MKRRHDEPEDTGTWMNTYSDLVTLLLTCFVLMFSFSAVDAEKWEAFVKAFANPGDDTAQVVLNVDEVEPGANSPFPNEAEGGGTGGDLEAPPDTFDMLYEYLEHYVEENGLESSVTVSAAGDSVVYIRFQSDIFFAPDEFALLSSAYPVLGTVGDALNHVQDELYIVCINGHTAETGDPNYAVSDWMLSSERASSVAIYLEEQKQLDPTKLRAIGYGKNYPVASNSTAEGRQQNRRVDLTIVKNDPDMQSADMEQVLNSLFDPTKFPTSGGVHDLLTPQDSLAAQEAPQAGAEAAPADAT